MIISRHQRRTGMAALFVLCAISGSAADWVGDVDQDWSNPLNWTGNVYPAGQNAVVNVATGNFPIMSANTGTVVDTIIGSVNGSAGRVDHRSGLHSTGLNNWTFVGINGGTGTYNLADTLAAGSGLTGFAQGTGSLYYGARFYIGRNGGNGMVNIHTTGTLSSGLFLVGSSGQGEVKFESGTATTFEVFVGGNESVGNLSSGGGTGVIRMSGGILNTTNRSLIGDGAATTGTMTMTGGTWNQNHTGALSIGLRDGNGTLIMNGASVLNDQSVVDTSNRSTNKGNVLIGVSGTGASTGSWIMNEDAMARVRYLGVAEAANTSGMLSMNGNASLTLSQDFTVGQRGTGTVNLNGGTISLNSGWAFIGGFAGANGAMDVNGGTLKSAVAGVMRLHVAYGGAGSLTVDGGKIEGLNLLAVGVLAGSSGTVQFNGGVVQSTGFSVGAGAANVNFNGGTVQATVNNTDFFSGYTSGNSELQTGGLVFDSNGRNVTASNSFDGAGGIMKIGGGTLTLSNINSYTGTTTVSAGALQVGSGGVGKSGAGATFVLSGGTLLGSGIVQGSSFTAGSGSTIHAGDGTAQANYGTLSFIPVSGLGSFDFQSGSHVILGINPGGTSDLLSFTGTGSHTLLFHGNLTVGPAVLTPTSEAVFNLLDWAGLSSSPAFASRYSHTGRLFGNGDEAAGLDLPDISGSGYFWDISNFITNGSIALVVVPEPSRALLLLLGFAGLLSRRCRIG
ncbi:MAG TPA: autotransporter-associated beta strand repeat-containing protein [Prosthecobacter sp.]|nr:autotransporter-associated beta strand repeat-containing protein [Prosthecobacter sp.]